MNTLVVGESGCLIPNIMEELSHSSELHKIQNLLESLLTVFELHFGERQLSFVRILQKRGPLNVLECILKKWQKNKKEEATLGKLIRNLQAVGLQETAQQLKDSSHFAAICNTELVSCTVDSERKSVYSIGSFRLDTPSPADLRKRFLATSVQQKPTRVQQKAAKFVLNQSTKSAEFISKLKSLNNKEKDLPLLLTLFCIQLCVIASLHVIFFLWDPYSNMWYDPSTKQAKYAKYSELEPLIGISYTVLAESYDEYQIKMRKIQGEVPIDLVIKLSDSKVWPKDAPLLGAQKIYKLSVSGILDDDVMLAILQETKNLQELEIIQTFCKTKSKTSVISTESDYFPSLRLDKLKRVKFQNFSECSNILNLLTTQVLAKNLQSLEIVDTSINHETKFYVQKLLKVNTGNLKRLMFSNTNWQTILLDDNAPQLQSLLELKLGGFWSQGRHEFQLMSKLSILLPSVQKFVLRKGYLPWNLLSNVLQLPSLESVIAGIEIPNDMKVVKLGELRNCHANLKNLELSLRFPSKLPEEECYIEGIHEVRRKFRKFMVEANCKISHLK